MGHLSTTVAFRAAAAVRAGTFGAGRCGGEGQPPAAFEADASLIKPSIGAYARVGFDEILCRHSCHARVVDAIGS